VSSAREDPDLVDEGPQARDVFRAGARQAGRPGRPRRVAWLRREADVLGVIALGGGLGSVARYATAELLPRSDRGFPWSTLLVNMVGCLLIGVLMVFITDVWRPGRYARPFLGIGVLGGLTTYSTMMLDLRTLGDSGEWLLAEGYLLGSLVGGLGVVWLGMALTRVLTQAGRRQEPDVEETAT
jgi:CrcB protein